MGGYLGEADINEMLADLDSADSAVEVIHGEDVTTGLYNRTANPIFEGEMPTAMAEGKNVHIKTGSLPDLAPGEAITVDGTSWIVRDIVPLGDGATELIALTQPS